MSVSVVAGLLLILGSYFVSQGNILYSVLTFFFADICWVMLSYNNGDIVGSIVILIGMLFGLVAYHKMNKGILRKDLSW